MSEYLDKVTCENVEMMKNKMIEYIALSTNSQEAFEHTCEVVAGAFVVSSLANKEIIEQGADELVRFTTRDFIERMGVVAELILASSQKQ